MANKSTDGGAFSIAVIGAGAAGLAAAQRLHALFAAAEVRAKIVLFEASARVGGLVATAVGNDYVCEEGPDTLMLSAPSVLELVKELDLSSQWVRVPNGHHRTHVVSAGVPRPLPDHFFVAGTTHLKGLLKTTVLPWRGALRAAIEPHRSRQTAPDESVEKFIRRRYGRDFYERVAEPLTTGVFGAQGVELSLRSTFPQLAELEDKHGSLTKGLRALSAGDPEGLPTHWLGGPLWERMGSFQKGLQQLTDTLARRMPPETLRLKSPVVGMEHTQRYWRLTTAEHGVEMFHAVCLAVPAPAAAVLMRSHDAQAAEVFSSTPCHSAAVLNLAYSNYHIKRPVEAPVIVIPARERRRTQHISLSTYKFPQRSPGPRTLIRAVMVGSSLDVLTDEAIEKHMRRDVSELLGIQSTPFWTSLTRHPRAVPVYPLGHVGKMSALRWRFKSSNLFLAGSAFDGYGLQEALLSGQKAAEEIFKVLYWNKAVSTY